MGDAERASHFLTAWEILPTSFSLQTGELGQTGKVNRAFLADKLSRTINRMYTGEEWEEQVPRKRSAEKFLVSHQLSNIVEDDEKGQRESQDKELLVHKEEGEEVRKGVSRMKISDEDLSTSKENEEDSGED